MSFTIEAATDGDVELIRTLIAELAEYEKMPEQAVATADDLRRTLFGPRPYAAAAEWNGGYRTGTSRRSASTKNWVRHR